MVGKERGSHISILRCGNQYRSSPDRNAATEIPGEIRKRFSSNDKLSDEDRKAIQQVVGKAIAPFQPKPDPEPKQKP